MVYDQLDYLGRSIRDLLHGFGMFTRFTASALKWMVLGSGSFGRMRLLMPQLYLIGTTSIPVVMLVGAFVGAVLGIEGYEQFRSIGQEVRMGGAINVTVVKQIGPVLAAVMIAGRVGGAVSAELGTMRVTEQLDALKAMGADPISYLVVPRILACLLMLPVLTVFSDLLGVFGGWLVVVRGFGVDAGAYWEFSSQFVGTWEVSVGLIKSVVFGLCIGTISCYKGFHCEPGAAGVGRATTDAFVTSFIAIIIANFFLAKFLNTISSMIYGPGGPTAFG